MIDRWISFLHSSDASFSMFSWVHCFVYDNRWVDNFTRSFDRRKSLKWNAVRLERVKTAVHRSMFIRVCDSCSTIHVSIRIITSRCVNGVISTCWLLFITNLIMSCMSSEDLDDSSEWIRWKSFIQLSSSWCFLSVPFWSQTFFDSLENVDRTKSKHNKFRNETFKQEINRQ